MRKPIYLFLLFLFEALSAQAQLSQAMKLESAAKIWGFLKYYHPQVAQGKLDWDQELIKRLPQIMETSDKAKLSDLYLNWIESLGEVKKCKSCKNTSSKKTFNENFDLSWTQDQAIFSPELSQKLKFIEENRFQGKNYYASSNNLALLNVTNEPTYKGLVYPDAGYRLLSLFKYWNVIEYFYPYKYQTDQKWDQVLTTMIPKFRDAADTTAYHLAMLELVSSIDDSHASLVTPYTNQYFGKNWLPAKFKILDGKAVITGYYNDTLALKDDLRIGDVISSVDGKDISEILQEKSRYLPASNKAVKLRDAYFAVFNGPTDQVRISLERDGKVEEREVHRFPFKEFHYKYEKAVQQKWKVMDNNIGYVNMGVLELGDVKDMMDSLKQCKAIIFDIRNYPRSTLRLIANQLSTAKHDFVKFIRPDFSYPGKFIWTNVASCGRNNKDGYKGKVVLLVNEQTQSHAEFTAMCLQAAADDVITVGSQTSGADGNVVNFKLLGDYDTRITGLGVFYPDGRKTQRIGIVPDVEVIPSVKGIKEGRDEVLEKAVEIIQG